MLRTPSLVESQRTVALSDGEDPLEYSDLLAEIVCSIVGCKCCIRVEQAEEAGVTILYILVPKEHRGKLIGKQGRTISALQVIFSAIGAVDDIRLHVRVVT